MDGISTESLAVSTGNEAAQYALETSQKYPEEWMILSNTTDYAAAGIQAYFNNQDMNGVVDENTKPKLDPKFAALSKELANFIAFTHKSDLSKAESNEYNPRPYNGGVVSPEDQKKQAIKDGIVPHWEAYRLMMQANKFMDVAMTPSQRNHAIFMQRAKPNVELLAQDPSDAKYIEALMIAFGTFKPGESPAAASEYKRLLQEKGIVGPEMKNPVDLAQEMLQKSGVISSRNNQ